jgi:hypothetical protein
MANEKEKDVDPRQKAHEQTTEQNPGSREAPKPQKVRVINKYEREY